MFRTDNGTEFVNEIFARLCSDQTIHHEHTGVDEPKHNGVVERGLGLIQEGGMTACFEPPRLFPGQLPDLDCYRVEAAIYMNDCLNATVNMENANYKSPYEMLLWETAAGQHPRLHATRKSPRTPHPQVRAEG